MLSKVFIIMLLGIATLRLRGDTSMAVSLNIDF